MSLIYFIKNILKHILPPPIKSFMREVDNLNDSVWRSTGQLEAKIEKIDQRAAWLSNRANQIYTLQTEMLNSVNERINVQSTSLEKLYGLFEAVNAENLRLYFDVKNEREVMLSVYKECAQSVFHQTQALNEIKECIARVGSSIDNLSCLINSEKEGKAEPLSQSLQRIELQFDSVSQRMMGLVRQSITHQDELLSPELYAHAIKMWYQNQTGKVLNLDKPITYNEKIQWLKVFDRDPRKTLLADKIGVRKWVADKIGDQYLIPLLDVYSRAEEIDFDALPDQFVLKASHGSGWNIIVHDKNTMNVGLVREKAATWLRKNFAFVNGYELHYLDIPRKILVEQYICNQNGDLPDYKFWCFQGKVHYIEYLAERQSSLKAVFFTRDWERAGFTNDHMDFDVDIPKPRNIGKMISIAEKLSAGFPHVRVDLYSLDDGSIKFGEMTFSSSSGIARWNPPEADEMLGKLLVLPGKENDSLSKDFLE